MKTTIVALILGFLLMVGLAWNNYDSAAKKAYANEFEAAASQLRVERAEVEKELNEVKDKLRHTVIGKAATGFVFEELSSELYEDAYPVLKSHDWTASVALTPSFFTEEEGKLSLKQLRSLLKHGWKTCILWEDGTSLSEYTAEMKSLFEDAELAFPSVLYVLGGDMRHLTEEDILKEGYSIVIHHGEKEFVISREDKDELFQLGCIPWNMNGVRQLVPELIDYGGSMLFYVDFSTSSGCYDQNQFENMCNYLSQHTERLYLSDIDGLRDNLQTVETDGYLLARKEFLEAELYRYDQEIAAVYEMQYE